MLGARMLPGEGRAAQSSVDEAREPRSVRSIRAQFERGSVPPAPARTTRRQPRAQAELAAFLKKNAERDDHAKKPPVREKPKGVNQLIQKFTDRAPFGERDLQRPEQPPQFDDPDTFGDHTHELELRHPKTDPGQLESYARIAELRNAPQNVPVSSDQSLREMVAFSASQPAVDNVREQQVPLRRSVSAARASEIPATDSEVYPYAEGVEQEGEEVSDWGAGDVHIQELFREAEETAERAVYADEQEEYVEAFELYWAVVGLYYKVIPFLSQEEGLDVHERIKMYTHRCECIRAAFEDDPEVALGNEDFVEPTALETTPTTPATPAAYAHVDAHENQGHAKPIQDTPTTPSKQSRHHGEGRSRPPVHGGARTGAKSSNKSTEDAPTTYPHHSTERRFHNIEQAQQMQRSQKSHRKTPQKATRSTGREKEVKPNSREVSLDNAELPLARSRLPDFSVSDPGPAQLPEAPRGPPGLGGAAAAHRNSLQRPISKSAVRASTNSVSRERMEEMQKRVKVMQDCLNNFTVKRKHLGPARALELQITTLNANTFGDLKRLEPLPEKLEHTWATELEVLLSMLQEIKEARPGQPLSVREDIAEHLPSLERCDKIVRRTMRSFAVLKGEVEYVEPETGGSAKSGRSRRKWWVKVPVVKQGGLTSSVRRVVQEAEKEMKSVFKIAHEINVEIVKSMPVPKSFVDALPKHARSLISRELKEGLTTWDMFKVSDFMKDRNLWSRDQAKEITSSLEKVALIWEDKTQNKSFLSRTLDLRGERLHKAITAFRRCQNAIRDLRRDWPTMQHTDLDMAKIENNEDIGLAGLEAYSRALESRAYRLLTRIRELLDADDEERRGSDVSGSGSSGGRGNASSNENGRHHGRSR